MNSKEHYPQRNVTLLPGDTIWATYKQPKGSQFNANTLKRLFGWKNGQRYIGRVRRVQPRDNMPGSTLVVDFYNSDERGKYQCSHAVYNIELKLVKGELTDLHYKQNPQPLLFEDEP